MKVAETLNKKKILIVDDINSIRMLARAILLDVGFRDVKQAKDGKDALKVIQQVPLDLIICDWNMPEMDGLTLFKIIQEDPKLKGIAFIMLTSSSEAEKVKKAISMGITDYILKPFSADILVNHVVDTLQAAG